MRFTVLILSLTPALLASPPSVAVVQPIERQIAEHADFNGRAEASKSVDVGTRVTGTLEKVLVQEGAEVKAGDLLFQINDRLQRAELAKAQAEVLRAEAHLKVAEVNFRRTKSLLDAKAISAEEVDKVAATMEEAKAGMEVARASLEIAKHNLDATRITSPIAGRIGRRSVDPGNIVRDSFQAEPLATIVALDPLHIAIDVDERTLLRFRRFMAESKAGKPKIGVAFMDEDGYPHEAAIDLFDNRVDPKTGTMRVRGTLANPKGQWLPGMFVRVRVALGEPRKATVIPESALVRVKDEVRAMIVNDKNLIEERTVRLGMRTDGFWSIEEGLKPSDWVLRDPSGRKAGEEVAPQRGKEPTLREDRRPSVAAPRPTSDFPGTGPALIVSASYPGANAEVVAQVVAAPLEAQLDGLDGIVHRIATCTDEGDLRLTLIAKKGTDLNKAMILAQKRIALATPTLPELVVRSGVTVKKRSVQLLAVAITSPDDSRERVFLGNYASVQLRDELARVSGVAEVRFHGDAGPSPQIRLEIDPHRLRAHGVTTSEILSAIRDLHPSSPANDRQPVITIGSRVDDVEKLNAVVIKSGQGGQVIYLRDIARIELVSAWGTMTIVDGKACVMLLVSRTADGDSRTTAKTVRERLVELAKRLPEGIKMQVIDCEP